MAPRVVEGRALYLECELERIVDGFGPNSLIIGRVVAASAERESLREASTATTVTSCIAAAGLLAYVAPGRFAVLCGTASAFPYPIDFRL